MEEMILHEEDRPAASEQTAAEPELPDTAAPEETEPQVTEDGTEPEEFTEAELAAWEELRAEYPALTAEDIPEDVFRLVSEGETPVHAMRRVELTQLRAENRALKQRLLAAETAQTNRLRTPGSMLGRAAVPTDAFLAGLEM